MTAPLNISRRTFLKATALVAGGLVIAFAIPQAKRFLMPNSATPADSASGAADASKLPAPNAFLRIGTDNSITVMLAHSEMGQGIWTTLPMLIAEELDADWSTIKVEHAAAAPAYVHTAYGIQITGGSSTTWSEFDRYRQAGALTRALLIDAAAQKFGVAANTLKTENGFVISGADKVSYGELAEAAASLPTPTSISLKDPKDWKIIGKATKRLDGPEKINGTAKFGQDVQPPETEPIKWPSSRTTKMAPGKRGAEPQVCSTVNRCALWPLSSQAIARLSTSASTDCMLKPVGYR